MFDEPRTCRYSAIQFVSIILILGIFAFFAFSSFDSDRPSATLPFGIFIALMGGYLVYMMTTKTIISDTEISSQSILGTKTLAWSEINRVSGSGYGIKLHNFDGDVAVTPSSQLPGYEEVVEFIGLKRPDLFNPQEYGKMRKNWTGAIPSIVIGTLVVGFGILGGIGSSQWFLAILSVVIGLFILAAIFSTPQSVTIQGNSLLIKYLFGEKTLRADEIESIQLRFQQSRNGRNYHVLLSLPGRKTIKVSSMKPGLPIAYLTLKNWHKRNIANSSSF